VYTDAILKDVSVDIGNLVLCYGDHKGLPALREIIVAEVASLNAEQALVTVGAAAALFIVATSLLEAGDELIVVRPNYATNIETPRAIGACIHFVDLEFDLGFSLDVEAVARAIMLRLTMLCIT
tara:strand:+ start:19262 stop:19633 length:372 start_codon:yes stop_codon:yes gene_type:complete